MAELNNLDEAKALENYDAAEYAKETCKAWDKFGTVPSKVYLLAEAHLELLKQRDGLVDDINKAMERVKKLEQTLEWYADKKHLHPVTRSHGEWMAQEVGLGENWHNDLCERARQALGEG